MLDDTGMASDFKIEREHLKPVPVGDNGWVDFSQKSYTADKTLLSGAGYSIGGLRSAMTVRKRA